MGRGQRSIKQEIERDGFEVPSNVYSLGFYR